MPQPEGRALHHNYNPVLTSMAQGMLAGLLTQYIARLIFPNLPVAVPSGTFVKWKRGDFMRRAAKRMANWEAPPIVGFGSEVGTFSVDTYALSAMWTAKDLANARAGGTSDAAFIRMKMLSVFNPLLLEIELATAALINSGAWARNWAGVTSAPGANQFIKFSQTASDPVQTMEDLKTAARDATGMEPNTIIMSEDVWRALKVNVNLIDRIKYGGTMDNPTQVTMQQLRALWEMDRIFIPKARYNTAKEGAPDVLAPVWGNNFMWVGYTTPTPTPEAPTAGYMFSWTGQLGLPDGIQNTGVGPNAFDSVQNDDGIFVKRYRENRPSAEFLDGEIFTMPGIVAPDLGHRLTDVV